MKMTLSQAATAIRAYLAADVPAFLSGPPGVGKSDLVEQVSRADYGGFIDLRVSLLDPVDLRGLPHIDSNGRSAWAPPEFLPDEARDGATGVLFLDELNGAPMSVQLACYQLVLNRRLGEYVMPPGWRIMAAGNRVADRAAASKMSSALANRFAHIEVAPDVESWCAWATGAGVHPLAVAFLRFRPELLHVMPGAKQDSASGRVFEMAADALAFPTPRSWAQCAKFMDSPDLQTLAAGLVGEGPAAELAGFVRTFLSLPRIESIIADPTGSPVPSDLGALYAVATALARKATPANFGAVLEYAERLRPEFMVLCVNDAVRRDPGLCSAPGYTRFAAKHQGLAA